MRPPHRERTGDDPWAHGMILIIPCQLGGGGRRQSICPLRAGLTARSIITTIQSEDLRQSMRYDDNHKERTRARVLTEAAAAFRSKGVERVGVAEVMAGAGLTHGGFYAHFKSKDELVAHAVTHMFDASYAWLLRHTEGREPEDALSN